ncbi:hypothetical protein JCGZ_16368 [Jatropha curcas]|uniref:Uncharacterized protein n=1 Tax=Jatropha curcas TaxID=180498 RepID=A0A067LIS1_JATCU|nr:uncharacterized protein LOC105650879 [Jatropha curcas]KDP44535.1 hypothetical protein JCGZ_16368 [Jatropha curcas]
MRGKANKKSKLMQITRAPIRILCKARDLYVKGMLDFADSGKVGYGSTGSGGLHLPKSFSVNSSSTAMKDEELKQLVQLFSCKQGDLCGMGRSYSVGVGKIGRIDEDRTCSFREDDNDGMDSSYLRNRSHVVRRKVV